MPLDKAQQSGYYEEMGRLIQNLFGQALKLKGNHSLYFAVLTGCLRVTWSSCGSPQESIFTGLNNMSILSITDNAYDEYFGFSGRDVLEMLEYYGVSDRFETVREWYDGYRFGRSEVYCPWDVVSYCARIRMPARRHSG